jgi:hypothetical protein
MKTMILAVLLLVGVLLVGVRLSVAQEADTDKFSFGKVVSVAADQVTVKEYDFAKDADVEVVYSVTAETELGNVNAVADLIAEDDVVIDYVEKEGKRVVTTLVKEEKGAEVPATAMDEGMAPVVEAGDLVAPAADAVTPEEVMVETPAETAPVQQ